MTHNHQDDDQSRSASASSGEDVQDLIADVMLKFDKECEYDTALHLETNGSQEFEKKLQVLEGLRSLFESFEFLKKVIEELTLGIATMPNRFLLARLKKTANSGIFEMLIDALAEVQEQISEGKKDWSEDATRPRVMAHRTREMVSAPNVAPRGAGGRVEQEPEQRREAQETEEEARMARARSRMATSAHVPSHVSKLPYRQEGL